jgi:lycopene cyclase domain-containing protein
MKEYTIISFVSMAAAAFVDWKSGVRVLRRREFYFFLAVILVFKLLVNGFLTGKEIVMYDPRFFLGIRVGSIPVEDFMFGFSMVTLTLVFWEYWKKPG